MVVSALGPLHRGASGPSLHPGKERGLGRYLTTIARGYCPIAVSQMDVLGNPSQSRPCWVKVTIVPKINWDITR